MSRSKRVTINLEFVQIKHIDLVVIFYPPKGTAKAVPERVQLTVFLF